jgi:hypothetical protein
MTFLDGLPDGAKFSEHIIWSRQLLERRRATADVLGRRSTSKFRRFILAAPF